MDKHTELLKMGFTPIDDTPGYYRQILISVQVHQQELDECNNAAQLKRLVRSKYKNCAEWIGNYLAQEAMKIRSFFDYFDTE